MKELQNIPVDKLVASSSSLGKFGSNTVITSALTTLFQKVVTQRACADGRCENADEEYFIGLEPKDKDFSAPKAAPEMNMAPVREIVRFDTVSYDNVPKRSTVPFLGRVSLITAKKFRQFGRKCFRKIFSLNAKSIWRPYWKPAAAAKELLCAADGIPANWAKRLSTLIPMTDSIWSSANLPAPTVPFRAARAAAITALPIWQPASS